MFFYHTICQNLHISVLILGFIFNIYLPIYKHVLFSPKQSPRILYLIIILESLKKTLVYHAYAAKPIDSLTYQTVHSQANFQNKDRSSHGWIYHTSNKAIIHSGFLKLSNQGLHTRPSEQQDKAKRTSGFIKLPSKL